jgi:hypothetical protein
MRRYPPREIIGLYFRLDRSQVPRHCMWGPENASPGLNAEREVIALLKQARVSAFLAFKHPDVIRSPHGGSGLPS